MLTRREFLRLSGAAIAGTSLLPPFLVRAARAAEAAAASQAANDSILVVVQMSGGNDGLNTVVPYGLDGYRAARSQIGIAEGAVLPLTSRLGLHPEMAKLHERYQAGQVAIVLGVGYPQPNLSHFRSLEIWHTAAPEGYVSSGWLGNYLAVVDSANPLYAVSVTAGLNPSFLGAGSVPAISSLQAYQYRTDGRYPADRSARVSYVTWVYGLRYPGSPLEEHVARVGATALESSQMVQEAASAYQSEVEYPSFPLANSLQTVAQLIAAGLGTRIYYVSFGGFDTHSNQPNTHARLLAGFSNSVDAFLRDLEAMGKADQAVLLTFSEFGRRVQENGSNGTDHGTAGPMFVIGHRVRGGLYGDYPSLTDLDGNRNLKYGIDFRSVYGTTLEGWLGADQELVLGRRYENVGFL